MYPDRDGISILIDYLILSAHVLIEDCKFSTTVALIPTALWLSNCAHHHIQNNFDVESTQFQY